MLTPRANVDPDSGAGCWCRSSPLPRVVVMAMGTPRGWEQRRQGRSHGRRARKRNGRAGIGRDDSRSSASLMFSFWRWTGDLLARGGSGHWQNGSLQRAPATARVPGALGCWLLAAGACRASERPPVPGACPATSSSIPPPPSPVRGRCVPSPPGFLGVSGGGAGPRRAVGARRAGDQGRAGCARAGAHRFGDGCLVKRAGTWQAGRRRLWQRPSAGRWRASRVGGRQS